MGSEAQAGAQRNPASLPNVLTLAVGDLANFGSLAWQAHEPGGHWRAQLGTHWHQVLRQRLSESSPNWDFEVPVTGDLWQGGWQFHLRGRIDQVERRDGLVRLREIKTIQATLPMAEDDLRTRWPNYFHQAMLYAFLLARDGELPAAEVVFVEIQTGLSQSVTLADADLESLRRHLDGVVELLDERAEHAAALRHMQVPPPFTHWRAGQATARSQLAAAIAGDSVVHFEAPTGFGKTGIALEQALHALADGAIDRIIILTGKNTGHTPLLNQIDSIRCDLPLLRAYALRSRKDYDAGDLLAFEHLKPDEMVARWRENGLHAQRLLEEGITDIDGTLDIARRTGIPAWFISRLLLRAADLWITDYNYLFAPGVASLLQSIDGFSPARTMLIVDEAHNLPDRVRACHSWRISASDIAAIHAQTMMARFPGGLTRQLDRLLAILKKQQPAESLEPPTEADLIGTLREVAEAWQTAAFGWDELDAAARDWLWNLEHLLADWDDPRLPMHLHARSRGNVEIACTDAASAIADRLRTFAKCLLMSATLQPWPHWRQSLGMDAHEGTSLVGDAPWLQPCFDVWIDARVDTRYHQRSRFFDLTARTIGMTASHGSSCLPVFFPSYQYARAIHERLQFAFPLLRCAIQPDNTDQLHVVEFVEEALLLQDVLFLVLGSRFSEAIDALGGKVPQAIVVSPALPEVNALQRAREQIASGTASQRFESVYLLPGLRKIIQALGRLIRHPHHRTRVLLHDQRFAQPAYRNRLPPYLQPNGIILEEDDFLLHWLR